MYIYSSTIYSGKIWQGLKFGDLASSLKHTKFTVSPKYYPQFIYTAMHIYIYGAAQEPEEDLT